MLNEHHSLTHWGGSIARVPASDRTTTDWRFASRSFEAFTATSVHCGGCSVWHASAPFLR